MAALLSWENSTELIVVQELAQAALGGSTEILRAWNPCVDQLGTLTASSTEDYCKMFDTEEYCRT